MHRRTEKLVGKKYGKISYFGRLLLFGLLIMAVPVLIMGNIWYAMEKKAEEKQVIAQEKRRMDLISLELGNRTANLEQEVIYLKYGKAFQNYRLDRTPSSTLALVKEMTQLGSMDSAIYDVYFYDEERQWIYTTSGYAKSIEEFYDTKWLEELKNPVSLQHLAARSSLDEAFVQYIQEHGLEDHYQNRQVWSIVSDGSHSAYFVVNLDLQVIGEELYQKYMTDGGEFYLTDSQGQILFGSGASADTWETETIGSFIGSEDADRWWNADGFLYYVHQAGYQDIYCVEKIAHGLVYGSVERYGVLILGVIVLITVGTAVLSAVMARKLYQPIGDLYQVMRDQNGQGMNSEDEIATITRTMRELNRSREDNTLEIARQRELLQAERLRLLLNQMISPEDFLKETQVSDSEQLHWRFLVCRMNRKERSYETENARKHLAEVLNTYLAAKEKGIFTEYQYGIYVALYRDDSLKEQVMYEVIGQMIKEQVYYAVSEGFCFGEAVPAFFEKTAREAENRQFFEETWEAKEAGGSREISVTNYEACLIRDILLGNDEAVSAKIEELKGELALLHSRDRAIEITQRILITVDRECRNKKDADRVNGMAASLQESENLTELTAILKQEFIHTCSNVNSNSGRESEYYTKACAYIQKNYSQNMSISQVADYLGISYAYLSKIFKSQSENEEKLLDYLNRIRIEKAKQLLAGSELSLTEVAEQVGYNNAQSLQRFFKKYETVTPGEWRRMQGRK